MPAFISEDTLADAAAAMQSFNDLFETLSSRGLFDAATFASMLTSLKSVARLALGLLQDIINVLETLVKYLIDQTFSLFSQPITSPLITGIYSHITGQASCTSLDLCSLSMAVLYTLLYKAVTGASPNAKLEASGTLGDQSAGQRNMSLGISTIVETIAATFQESSEIVSQ